METRSLGILVVLFIGIVVALAMLPEMGSTVNEMTELRATTNETLNLATARVTGLPGEINSSINFSLTNAPSGWKVDKCPITSLVVLSSNGTTLTGSTIGTGDYVPYTSVGIIQFNNTAKVNATVNSSSVAANSSFGSYAYCDDGYVTGATSTMIKLVLLFAALGLLGFAVWGVWQNRVW